MIQIDKSMLRKLQLIELEMLIEVDRICRKNSIRYNIYAGTLLGAARHGGYIPWDDDADISMLRTEYEKFREACEKDLDTTRFYFQDHRNTKGYRWGYGKIRRKNTVFMRENQEHMPYEQGVFIDIFPMDNVPNNKVSRKLHNFVCWCIRKTLWSEVGKIADKKPINRCIFKLLSKIPEKAIFSTYQKVYHYSNKKKTKCVRILTFPTATNDYGYDRKWFEELSEMEFENHIFIGTKDYNEFLEYAYGDYMKLPPENKRKVHPVSKIKLI